MKISALNFSQTGNTEKMAGVIRNGIREYGKDIDVSLMNIIAPAGIFLKNVNNQGFYWI